MPTTTLDSRHWTSHMAGNPILWMLATLIVIGFASIWLAFSTDEIESQPVKKLSSEMASTDLKQAEDIIKQETMAISDESDESRAQAYLQSESIETSVKPLFDAAQDHMQNGQYVLPKNDSAWFDYNEILTIDAGNTKASSGLTKIRNLLIDNADTAIEAGDLADAENWVAQLDVIQPGEPIQKDLRDTIKTQIALEEQARLQRQKEQERIQNIENFLSQAQDEQTKLPLNFNKIKQLYNRVLELDSGNARALSGLDNLSDSLLNQAELALRNNQLFESQTFINQARYLAPTNRRLSSMQLALDVKRAQNVEIEEARQQSNPIGSDKADAIDDIVESIGESTKKRETSDVTITQDKNNSLTQGIKAYYDGNYNKSYELLYPLAEEGMPRAQFRIGVMYRYGRSVSKNSDLSEKWFNRALSEILRRAQSGEAWAQTDLGTAYELGISRNQDFERAAHWYRLAAEQGYPGAQTNLGVLYANGEGVEYNRSQAVFWLTKAANQGDLVAIENLKIMGIAL